MMLSRIPIPNPQKNPEKQTELALQEFERYQFVDNFK